MLAFRFSKSLAPDSKISRIKVKFIISRPLMYQYYITADVWGKTFLEAILIILNSAVEF